MPTSCVLMAMKNTPRLSARRVARKMAHDEAHKERLLRLQLAAAVTAYAAHHAHADWTPQQSGVTRS